VLDTGVPGWLLLDYGQVLCTAPPAPEWEQLRVAAGGPDPAGFESAYWQHRPAYDGGDLDPASYWARVAPNGDLARLRRADVAIWLHPDHGALSAARRAAQRGWRLALLSNAPHEVADAIDGLPWLAPVAPRLFSCRIGAVKPDPAAYRHALSTLGATPEEVTFVDDRPANVAAAAELGLRAVVYRGPATLDGL
jgi:putative hydrolase of the HAD superfamily